MTAGMTPLQKTNKPRLKRGKTWRKTPDSRPHLGEANEVTSWFTDKTVQPVFYPRHNGLGVIFTCLKKMWRVLLFVLQHSAALYISQRLHFLPIYSLKTLAWLFTRHPTTANAATLLNIEMQTSYMHKARAEFWFPPDVKDMPVLHVAITRSRTSKKFLHKALNKKHSRPIHVHILFSGLVLVSPRHTHTCSSTNAK